MPALMTTADLCEKLG
jgi:hypothetical protein